MNAPTRIDPLAIPVEQIHHIIAKANALLAKPRRDGVAWLNFLCAVDTVEGCDALREAIECLESDLGYGDADELVTMPVRGEGFDADQVQRSSVWF